MSGYSGWIGYGSRNGFGADRIIDRLTSKSDPIPKYIFLKQILICPDPRKNLQIFDLFGAGNRSNTNGSDNRLDTDGSAEMGHPYL